jgi:hypothetical protein
MEPGLEFTAEQRLEARPGPLHFVGAQQAVQNEKAVRSELLDLTWRDSAHR